MRATFLRSLFAGALCALGLVPPLTAQDAAQAAAAARLDQDLNRQLATGRRWALLVGVDQYKKDPLRFCGRDAVLLKETLIRAGGFTDETVVAMTDTDPKPDLHPTADNIKRQLEKMLIAVQPGDTFVFLFSGHGAIVENRCLLCAIDSDGEGVNGLLPVDDTRDYIAQCKAAQKIIILDCCHSGATATATIPDASGSDLVTGPFEFAQGCITFTACRSFQTSVESSEEQQGVFSVSLCRGLEGAADFDRNTIVDSDELYRHLLAEVPAAAKAVVASQQQTPVRVIGPDVVGVFALCRVTPPGDRLRRRRVLQPGDSIRNSIGMKLTALPSGLSIMGSPTDEYLRGDDEQTEPVVLTQRTLLGTCEVTQREYETVMGDNPSCFSETGDGASMVAEIRTGRFPVEQVTWEDAVTFCNRLSELPEEQAAGRSYRLPTEAEWEFACRAGSLLAFSTGEIIDGTQASIRADRPYWYADAGESLGRPRLVGSYSPNAFSLHDLHGNVAEWCFDYYTSDRIQEGGIAAVGWKVCATTEEVRSELEYVGSQHWIQSGSAGFSKTSIDMSLRLNPTGPTSGSERVTRGGSYTSVVAECRSAARRPRDPEFKHRTLGFRVVCQLTKPVYLDE
jgi:formylglycine-generating enzyme required for sulfatase activity